MRANSLHQAGRLTDLTTVWTIKEYPHGKIGRELLKAVFLSRGHKNERPLPDGMSGAAVEEQTFSASHHIYLVSGVWPLLIAASRRIELTFKRTVREDRHGEISRRWFAVRERCLQGNDDGFAAFEQCDGLKGSA
jgi:hypothetical protein